MVIFNNLIKLYILWHYCIVSLNCLCILNFPSNQRNIPKYTKSFGSRTFDIPYTAENVFIQENETITGNCATTFNDFDYEYIRNHFYSDDKEIKTVTGYQTILLQCLDSKIYYGRYKLSEAELSCADPDLNMYEPAVSLAWCEKNVVSYILALSYSPRPKILSGLCFDIEKAALRNAYYSADSSSIIGNYNNLHISAPKELNGTPIAVEITNFKTAFIQSRFNELPYDQDIKSQQHNWLKLANYQYHSIVQASPYKDEFAKYDDILNIIWWPNLLYGNWENFTNTLEDHLNNVTHSYDIFAGTSGILQMPLRGSKCMQSEIQELRFGTNIKTIPAYVWNYLKASDDSEEFVVVGYNSPFYDFFPENDIVFCKDICDQITWIKEIRSTFRYSALGVIFCCSVEDVRKFNYLDGFPRVKETVESEISPTTVEVLIETTTPEEDENFVEDELMY